MVDMSDEDDATNREIELRDALEALPLCNFTVGDLYALVKLMKGGPHRYEDPVERLGHRIKKKKKK